MVGEGICAVTMDGEGSEVIISSSAEKSMVGRSLREGEAGATNDVRRFSRLSNLAVKAFSISSALSVSRSTK